MGDSNSRRLSREELVVAIGISLFLLVLGNILVRQRSMGNSFEPLMVRGDSNQYILMAEGKWSESDLPFKYRVLAPFVASLLPLSGADSLKIVTNVCLFLIYFLSFAILRQMKITIQAAIGGVFMVWGAAWQLYYFHNPFLTDAALLLFIYLMFFAFLEDNFFLFLISAVLGVLSRETALFALPLWLLKKRKAENVLLFIVVGLFFLIPRLLFTFDIHSPSLSGLLTVLASRLDNIKSFTIDLYNSWGIIWIFSIVGLVQLEGNLYKPVRLFYFLLIAGAVCTSLIATDTGRMFSIMAPVMVTTCARMCMTVCCDGNILERILLTLLIVIQPLISFKYSIFAEYHFFIKNVSILFKIIFVFFLLVFVFNHARTITQKFNNRI